MPRKPRIHFPGAFYHVIARGNAGRTVFRNGADYRLYLQFLEEYKARFGFSLYAYALMPTHVHLLLEVKQIPLSRLMQGLQFQYTLHFNRTVKQGHFPILMDSS